MANEQEYRKNGFMAQREKGSYAMRIRTRAGNMTSQQFCKVAELADKYGQGKLHLTNRQALEIPGVPETHYADILREVQAAGLLTAVTGLRLRTIVACPGNALCRFGLVATATLAEQLDEVFVGCEMPAKTKLGISGCPNSCAKPQGTDIGLQGAALPIVKDGCIGCGACVRTCLVNAVTVTDKQPVIDPEKCVACGRCAQKCPKQAIVVKAQGYNIYVGGKFGRQPILGAKIFAAVPEQAAEVYVAAIIRAYKQLGNAGERIAQMLSRIGLDAFVETIKKELNNNDL